LTEKATLTDGKHPNDAVNSDTDHPLAFIPNATTSVAGNELNPNIDCRLLTESYDLGPGAPVPAYEGFICPSRDEVLGRYCDGANSVEMTRKLLKRGEGDRGEKMHATAKDGMSIHIAPSVREIETYPTSWNPTTKTSDNCNQYTPQNNERMFNTNPPTFFCQEVNTTNRFLNL
jgi:hypothetical protein